MNENLWKLSFRLLQHPNLIYFTKKINTRTLNFSDGLYYNNCTFICDCFFLVELSRESCRSPNSSPWDPIKTRLFSKSQQRYLCFNRRGRVRSVVSFNATDQSICERLKISKIRSYQYDGFFVKSAAHCQPCSTVYPNTCRTISQKKNHANVNH